MQALTFIKLSVICLLLWQVSACSFHLKGHAPEGEGIVTNITELSLGGNLKYNEVASAVKEQAEQANIKVVDGSDVIITLDNIEEENTRIGGTQGGDVEQYRLRLTASWELHIKGQLLLPKKLSVQQFYDYLPANQLANDQERQLIRTELEKQLASSILRQAIAIANNPPPCDCDEAETGTTATKP
ncbi:MAG: hypothetical protein KAG18_02630 [Sinobacterium sp.]|nr:hypothetical protein [Sinobacterium sp.]